MNAACKKFSPLKPPERDETSETLKI